MKNIVTRATQPIVVGTANGTIVVDVEARARVPQLDQWVWAKIMPATPMLMSVGQLVREAGFSFLWSGESCRAWLLFPERRHCIELFVNSNVPLLRPQDWERSGQLGLCQRDLAVLSRDPDLKAPLKRRWGITGQLPRTL